MNIWFNIAPQCEPVPQFANAYASSDRNYYGESVVYRCNDQYVFTDGTTSKSIICFPNETTSTLYWKNSENVSCVKATCAASSAEFSTRGGVTDIDPLEPFYQIDSQVKFTCANGFIRDATCVWDKTQRLAVWKYQAKCIGVKTSYLFLLNDASFIPHLFKIFFFGTNLLYK